MIQRDIAGRVRALAKAFPAVTITGPRQSGKSTLCRAMFPEHPYANLDTHTHRNACAAYLCANRNRDACTNRRSAVASRPSYRTSDPNDH